MEKPALLFHLDQGPAPPAPVLDLGAQHLLIEVRGPSKWKNTARGTVKSDILDFFNVFGGARTFHVFLTAV